MPSSPPVTVQRSTRLVPSCMANETSMPCVLPGSARTVQSRTVTALPRALTPSSRAPVIVTPTSRTRFDSRTSIP